ncbi:MAG: 30S ribosomal protein S17, partial [Patescibacteria group bacterium]
MKNTEKTTKGKQLTGTVVSDKMKDTCVVTVDRYIKVPKYEKFIMRSKKYKADDKGNTKKIGDKATIEECRPISKDKH